MARTQESDNKIPCPICGDEVGGAGPLVSHIRYHRERACACGCGQPVMNPRAEYVRGHRPLESPADMGIRLWGAVKFAGGDKCWEWQGSRTLMGYGQISFRGSHVYTHRAVFISQGVDLGPDDYACHRCDNPPCVRPDHLYVGDASTNMYDAWRHGGRVKHRVGTTIGTAL